MRNGHTELWRNVCNERGDGNASIISEENGIEHKTQFWSYSSLVIRDITAIRVIKVFRIIEFIWVIRIISVIWVVRVFVVGSRMEYRGVSIFSIIRVMLLMLIGEVVIGLLGLLGLLGN